MNELIHEFLCHPTESRASTLEAMLGNPNEAFEALISFRGPYPPHVDVMDVYPDHIQPLLCDLIKRTPQPLLDCDTSKLTEGQRWVLVYVAIESNNPQFAEIILKALEDTEDAGQDLAIKAISQRPYLRTTEAKDRLLKLAELKSMRHLREDIQSALKSFERL